MTPRLHKQLTKGTNDLALNVTLETNQKVIGDIHNWAERYWKAGRTARQQQYAIIKKIDKKVKSISFDMEARKGISL